MGRKKNALRQHLIAELDAVTPSEKPELTDYKLLAEWITDITDETDEETETTAYYDGDGTPITDVISVAMSFAFSGTYDSANAAMKMINDMKLETGDGRKVWHMIIESDGENFWEGIATVTDIVCGSGPASAYEEFGCTITYDKTPDYDEVEVEEE